MPLYDAIYNALKQLLCRHHFKFGQITPRNLEGNVKWSCCKCGKTYTAHCGLKILEKGKYIL